MKETVIKDDLLFHSAHGLCRVSEVSQTRQSDDANYVILPVSANRAKVRFIVPESSLENSGFNKLISTKEAEAVLEYFKTGEKKPKKVGQVWEMAELICAESKSEETIKDSRKRQKLDQCVKGLAGEIAYVLKMTVPEVIQRMRKNLKSLSEVNPLVLTLMANAEKE